MATEELMVDGLLYHGPGGCPKCGTPLFVADSELTLMEVNKEGIPISEETSIRCEGVCQNCGTRLEMVRWNGGYIPYSKTSLTLKTLERRDEIKDRIDELNSSSKENPLAIV